MSMSRSLHQFPAIARASKFLTDVYVLDSFTIVRHLVKLHYD